MVQRAAKDAQGRISSPPNYILLALGIVLVLLQVFVVSGRTVSPVGNAALVAIGVTLALYGIYPVSVMNGEFTGVLGRLAVAGPAAIGLFVFFFVFNALNRSDSTVDPDGVVLLTTSTTGKQHNSRTINKETIRLLDVDSFDEDRVAPPVDRLLEVLQANGFNEKEAQAQVKRMFLSFLPQLRLGQPHQQYAAAAISTYIDGGAGANEAWQKAVQDAAAAASSREQVEGRVKRLPFALITLNDGARPQRMYLLSEGSRVTVGGKTYDLPVIANPTRRYVPNLEEAIVLTAAAQ